MGSSKRENREVPPRTVTITWSTNVAPYTLAPSRASTPSHVKQYEIYFQEWSILTR